MAQQRRRIEVGHGLERVSRMMAQACPDVKVAVPAGRDGRPAHESGLCHEKAGITTDYSSSSLNSHKPRVISGLDRRLG